MALDVRHVGMCAVVRVGDRFDASSAGSLGHAISQLAREDLSAHIIVDLSDVSLVGPNAIAALWAALDTGDVPVAIINTRLSARRIMRRWGGKRLLVFPTVAMAVEAFEFAAASEAPPAAAGGFRHEAFLYAGTGAFVEGTAAFIDDALGADEPVMVAVSAEKIELLRERLTGDAARVSFVDMGVLGRNPARIIPAWQDFVAGHRGRHVRGIGEPISTDRGPVDLVECQHHESLLNLAFADSPAWWLLCPYDTAALAAGVIDEARRSHPTVLSGGEHERSVAFVADRHLTVPLEGPLPPPPDDGVAELAFDATSLRAAPAFAARHADQAGLWPDQVRDVARAVAEVVANSVLYGGGEGRISIWREGGGLVCEVRDRGHITEPLVGRTRPDRNPEAGRGLWLVNQLCDLVQIRSSAAGTVVRLHIRRR